MMRVLYLCTELDIGGAERCLYQLATRLDRDEFDPEVVCLSGHGEIGRRLEEAGIPVGYLDARPRSILKAVRRFRKQLKKRPPDILHTFLYHANLVGRLAAWRTPVRCLLGAVRVEEKRSRLRLWLDRITRGMVHGQTCVSESTRRFTAAGSRYSLDRLFTIHNGVDLAPFDLPRGKVRQEFGVPDGDPVITAIGRLDPQKGLADLIDAFSALAPNHPTARLWIVGQGGLEADLRAQAARPPAAERITFLGWRADIPQILRDTDIYALPSLWEGCPNTVLEAMAAARPVVASDVGGCRELIVDGETGILLPSQAPERLADALGQLLASPALARQYGDQGRQRVEQEFSLQRMVEKHQDLYRRLLAEHAPA